MFVLTPSAFLFDMFCLRFSFGNYPFIGLFVPYCKGPNINDISIIILDMLLSLVTSNRVAVMEYARLHSFRDFLLFCLPQKYCLPMPE